MILTPNRRLAAFSQQQFNREQMAHERNCWPTPEIYPIEAWLTQVWDLCLEHNLPSYRPLISDKQQQLLFEQIIQESNVANELLRVNATAQNALQAWGFLRQWQVDINKLAAYADFSPDTAAFYTWLQTYILWLEQNKYFDSHLMIDCLIDHLPEIISLLPKKICLRGFNELTPQYHSLFAKFAANGIEITHDQLTMPGAKVFKAGFEDYKAELNIAALWAADLLQQNENQLIGIVIPDLEQLRSYVHNSLGPSFPAGWLNISAPLPLSNYDLISSALHLLQLAEPIINYNDFSILLRCPFIDGFWNDYNQNAQLDRNLREIVEAKVHWEKLIILMNDTCGAIKNCSERFVKQFAQLHGKHSAYHWVQQIQRLLQCWGWPGDGLNNEFINTQEMDLLTCWRSLLEEYCKLGLVIPAHTFAEALQLIRRLANEIPFSPAEIGLTKVHILGLLEAEGLVFDHLWICGMSRDTWPPAANPNPFIPLELQRQFDLPHNSAQRELSMAQKYTTNLEQGGKHTVIFSYPTLVDDYSMEPSNLIAHIPEEQIKLKYTFENFIPEPLEQWQDTMAPIFTEPYISGGGISLRLQAQCPFKANAELRLQAKALLDPAAMLTPAMRGSLVHEVLENFWHKCNSHAQLVSYTAEELEKLLRNIIQESLQIWQRAMPLTLTNNYLILEANRLYNLISRWLEYETKRSAFVVYQLENKTLISIGPLQINMRIDRIDQVDGNYVIIDYKTGETNVSQWFTEPIYDPQLPIYAVSFPQNVVAVAFASLRAAELKFIGIAADDGILPQVKTVDDWHTLQQDWLQRLQKTAEEFVAGNAIVDPFSTQVCNMCRLQAFCRIYEQTL